MAGQLETAILNAELAARRGMQYVGGQYPTPASAPSIEQIDSMLKYVSNRPTIRETTMASAVMLNQVPQLIREKLPSIENIAWDSIKAMTERQRETKGFTSDIAAYLAGIYMNSDARDIFNTAIDNFFRYAGRDAIDLWKRDGGHEVIIGGGYHAAVYCAVRRSMGKPRPLVIESSPTVGGVFGMTKGPAFFLNSRNRPGPGDVPGGGRGLNTIPGSPIQPADLSASEYQRNSDLAFAIKMTLLMNARVITLAEIVNTIGLPENKVKLDGLDTIQPRRLIDARGLGRENTNRGKRILSYSQFMERMDTKFPMEGMGRVAVIGGGDSGKTVVEALLGMGPSQQWSVASLDSVDQVYWYDVDFIPRTCEEWRRTSRSRYMGIGSFMPRSEQLVQSKIMPVAASVSLSEGYNCAYVSGRPFDYAIACTGYCNRASILAYGVSDFTYLTTPDRTRVARLYKVGDREQAYIGAGARLVYQEAELQLPYANIPENQVAMFRLGPKTAMAAAMLD